VTSLRFPERIHVPVCFAGLSAAAVTEAVTRIAGGVGRSTTVDLIGQV
jgi:hypothetical protein